MIKAILVDPMAQTITEVETEDSLEAYYKLLDVDCIDIAPFWGNNSIVVDDGGMFKAKAMFSYNAHGKQVVLANKCLVVGCYRGSEDFSDVTMTVENVESMIGWLPNDMVPEVAQRISNDVKVVVWNSDGSTSEIKPVSHPYGVCSTEQN